MCISANTGLGTFDAKSHIPKSDRLDNYKLQWEREPKIQTFPRTSSYSGYDESGFMVTRTQAQVVDPERKMREEVNTIGWGIAHLIIFAGMVVTIAQHISNYREEQELNAIQRRKQSQ